MSGGGVAPSRTLVCREYQIGLRSRGTRSVAPPDLEGVGRLARVGHDRDLEGRQLLEDPLGQRRPCAPARALSTPGCGITSRVTRRARAIRTIPSARSDASTVRISAPEVGRVVEVLADPPDLSRTSTPHRPASRRRAPAAVRAGRPRWRPPGAAPAASPATRSTRTSTRSLTLWTGRAVPIPSSWASTRPATKRSASSRSAVRFDSVKNRSSAIRGSLLGG